MRSVHKQGGNRWTGRRLVIALAALLAPCLAPAQTHSQQPPPSYDQGARPGPLPQVQPAPRDRYGAGPGLPQPGQGHGLGQDMGQGRGPGQPGLQPSRNQHLPEWMQQHQHLNARDQEQALRSEPGFNRLPAPQQQHLIDRLHKLDNAPPEVRQRILARNEMFERLPPEQRQEIRGAGQALAQMPPDRNMAVRHAFRDLRGLPPEQRAGVLNSARFQAEFSTQERTVLGHLLSIEPYQP